jgi:WD40 repeat protein
MLHSVGYRVLPSRDVVFWNLGRSWTSPVSTPVVFPKDNLIGLQIHEVSVWSLPVNPAGPSVLASSCLVGTLVELGCTKMK